mmetsp:Transcript_124741/g.353104  ORF Transcript_124741/g.353104 Transcript_124741/m.353104 type:complete len:428 (+) Transcript_124741:232-1515(+)
MSTYPIQVEGPISPGMHQAFQDMIIKQQASMVSISKEHKKMADKVSDLEAQNKTLQEQNAALKAQVSGMGAEPAVVAGGAAVAGAAVGAGAVAAVARSAPTSDEAPGPAGEPFVLVKKIKIHDQPIHSVAIHKDSEVIATASWDASVKLYDLEKGEVVKSLEEDTQGTQGKMLGLYAVAFAKMDPRVLGCTSCDTYVYLWDHTSGKMLRKLAGHTNEVNGLDFHPTQQVLCSASDDKKALVWDFTEGIVLRTLDKHTMAVYGTAFLGQENQYLVATCCFDQETRIFDMRTKEQVHSLKGHDDDVIGIDYNGATAYLATGSDDGTIKIYDCRKNWEVVHDINTNVDTTLASNEVKRVRFSHDGQMLAAACSTGRVLVYDMNNPTNTPIANLKGHEDCVFDVAWGKNKQGKKMLVSASHDFSANYWIEQ